MSNDPASPRIPLPPLPILLRQLNKRLDWQPFEMAEWMGKDQAEISRWLSLKKKHRLQDATLEFVARRYQEAGLAEVTAELLKEARDYGGSGLSTALQIPDHWLRFMGEVLTRSPRFQDILFRKWSHDLEASDQLVMLGMRGEDESIEKRPLTKKQSTESSVEYWKRITDQDGDDDLDTTDD